MTERWQDYFTQASSDYHSLLAYAADHWNYHHELYFNIGKVVKAGAKVLEVGCGLGFSTIYLQESGYKVTGIDNDTEIVEQARLNAGHFHSNARFEQADAFRLSKYHDQFDLVYSVGVVEHFDHVVTVDLLKEQAKCAEYVVAVIPTKYTKYTAVITDERIYTLRGLRALFADAGMEPVGQFGYGNVISPFHNKLRKIIPCGLYGFLQYNRSYAMEIACIGRKK